MEKTPEYVEAQKRDPRNPPSPEEEKTEKDARMAAPKQQEGATPT